jgi:hypothetical protein
MYSFLRIVNVSCFYFPNFIFKIQFWIYKVHVGNIYFCIRIIHFQHWKNEDKHLTTKQQSQVRIPRKLASQVSIS